jgi:hypothetical protein
MKKKRMLALLSSVNFARRVIPSVIGSFTYFGFALLTPPPRCGERNPAALQASAEGITFSGPVLGFHGSKSIFAITLMVGDFPRLFLVRTTSSPLSWTRETALCNFAALTFLVFRMACLRTVCW